MEKLKKWSKIWLALFCVFLLAACSNDKQQSLKQKTVTETEEMEVSFVRSYGNLGALTENSEKIAVVKVLDDGVAEDVNGLISTINEVEVLQPIYGCVSSVDRVLKGTIQEQTIKFVTDNFIGESGTGVTLFEYIDDPWMQPQEQYLVCLKETENGMYQIVGSGQGRLAITDGKVTSLKNLYPEQMQEGMDLREESLEQVVSLIK